MSHTKPNKKLLFVVSKCLGEALFSTPTIDILSNEYDVYVYCVENLKPIFEKYSFVKKVIWYPKTLPKNSADIERSATVMPQLLEHIGSPKSVDAYIAWQDDSDAINFSNNSTYLSFFKLLPMESSCVLYKKNISRTRKVFLKMRLGLENNIDSFDLRIRKPKYDKAQTSNVIIINEGAGNKLRRLSFEVLCKFSEKFPNAIFILDGNTAKRMIVEKTNVKFLTTTPSTEKTLTDIISLFESCPKCIITPDTGLAHLATAYEIPMIWIETWVDHRRVLEKQSMYNIKMYKKTELTCLKNCNAKSNCSVWRHPNTLECNSGEISCLNLNDNDIDKISKLVIDFS